MSKKEESSNPVHDAVSNVVSTATEIATAPLQILGEIVSSFGSSGNTENEKEEDRKK